MEAFLNFHDTVFHWRECPDTVLMDSLMPFGLKAAYDQQKADMDKLQGDVAQLAAEAEAQRTDADELRAANEQLQRARDFLSAELELIMNYKPASVIDAGTPAEKMLAMMAGLLAGKMPPVADIVFVQNCIIDSQDIYRPCGLRQQILHVDAMDEDVRRSLIMRLGETSTCDVECGASEPSRTERSKSRPASHCDFDFVLTPTRSPKGQSPKEDFHTLEGALTALAAPGDAIVSCASDGIWEDSVQIPRSLKLEVEHALRTVGHWQFDAFHLDDVTNGHSLSCLGFFLFSKNHLILDFELDAAKLACFLRRIEQGYQKNPYHSSVHATDVLQTLHMLLHRGGLVPHYADMLTIMACYFAAIVHDFEHGGLTNDFLINTGEGLALLYNDKAPLENHHLAAAFALLRQPECNFMPGLKKQEADRFRKMVIEMVLATDMKQHFNMMSHFNTAHCISANPGPSDMKHREGDEERTPSPLDENERMLSLQMALKCADLGHTAADLQTHLRWVGALEEEFFRQGDRERVEGLTISPLFDRFKQGITKSQVGFFDIVVVPVFTSFTSVFTAARPLLSSVINNYNHWVEQKLLSTVETEGCRTPAPVRQASCDLTIKISKSLDREAFRRGHSCTSRHSASDLPAIAAALREPAIGAGSTPEQRAPCSLPGTHRLFHMSRSDGSLCVAELDKWEHSMDMPRSPLSPLSRVSSPRQRTKQSLG